MAVAVTGLARGEGTKLLLPFPPKPVHPECVSYESERLCLNNGGGGGRFTLVLEPPPKPVRLDGMLSRRRSLE